MIFNFHPFFGHAIDPKRLRLKGWNFSQVIIMRSNWGRLTIIFVILGVILIFPNQSNFTTCIS
jgi:hypothetical protein